MSVAFMFSSLLALMILYRLRICWRKTITLPCVWKAFDRVVSGMYRWVSECARAGPTLYYILCDRRVMVSVFFHSRPQRAYECTRCMIAARGREVHASDRPTLGHHLGTGHLFARVRFPFN